MEAQIQIASFKEVLIVLGAAAVVIPLFFRLRISSALGFILVGIVVGPFGLGRFAQDFPWLSAVTIADQDSLSFIAQFGVVALLFMIGLELSFERLWVMRRLVFGLGPLQIILCSAVLAAMAYQVLNEAGASIVIGIAGAMSSTAVVVQVLSESKRLITPVGRSSFAVLLFQDLAVVPVLFALAMLSPTEHGSGIAGFAFAAGKAVMAVVGIVALGRLILRPLFRGVARTQSPELFMAACLLVVVATALASASAGLSMALGALIGGLLLAGTEYRRQVEITIEPFKGLLVGVFLISVGMGLDLGKVAAQPAAVAGTACLLVLLKFAVVTPLVRTFGQSWGTALQTGLMIGPGGEFGFVILSVAAVEGLVPTEADEIALLAVALTMTCIPLLSGLGQRIGNRLAPPRQIDPALGLPAYDQSAPRVVIAGFGRVGQTVAAMLDVHKLRYVAIDRDVDRVAKQRSAGHQVFYGDITRPDLLKNLNLATARALVVTMDDHRAVDEVVAAARATRPDLLIIARARDAAHAAHLYRTGASDAIPETVEASLQLSEAVLVDLDVPMGPVIASIHEKRAEFQTRIKAFAPEAEIRPIGRRRLRDARGDSDVTEAAEQH